MLRTWSKPRFDFTIEVMTASPWTDHCTIIKEVPWRWLHPNDWKTRSSRWKEKKGLSLMACASNIFASAFERCSFLPTGNQNVKNHADPFFHDTSPPFVHCVSSTHIHSSSFTVFLPANSWGLLKVPPPGVPVPSPMPPSSSSGVAKPESRLDGLRRWKTRTKIK